MIQYGDYRKTFFEFTSTLEPVLLGQICLNNSVDVLDFVAWINYCPVRQAKMNEITHSRIIAMEKKRK